MCASSVLLRTLLERSVASQITGKRVCLIVAKEVHLKFDQGHDYMGHRNNASSDYITYRYVQCI